MNEQLNCGTYIPWMLLRNIKEQSLDMYNKLDESQRNYTE